jgi:uroporphyrinogen decarboxylase
VIEKGMRLKMNQRENIIRAMKRQNPDYVPFAFSLCNSLFELFKEKTGEEDYLKYFQMPYRNLSLLPTKNEPDYEKYYKVLPQGAYIDDWGVAQVPGGLAHFTKMMHPMESFTSPEQVWNFPLPDLLEDYRWEGYKNKVAATKDEGLLAAYSAIQIFEYAWYLRGMDNLMVDMLDDEAMATACIDRMTSIQCALARRLAGAGIDMIVYGDDVGTQRAMMMDPTTWRKWLKPSMEKAIRAAKEINPDIIAYYHSDGVIYDIIPDLIEIGVDVLNPVQPECMDPIKVKELYGDKLSFWGTIGTQTTMPFGTPQEVEETVRLMIEKVGVNGGLVIAPTHLLEPEVPWENIMAFVNAVKKYGKYI